MKITITKLGKSRLEKAEIDGSKYECSFRGASATLEFAGKTYDFEYSSVLSSIDEDSPFFKTSIYGCELVKQVYECETYAGAQDICDVFGLDYEPAQIFELQDLIWLHAPTPAN